MFNKQPRSTAIRAPLPKCDEVKKPQYQSRKPVSETEKRFMGQPNRLLPRVVLNPEQPEERAWRFLSNVKRKGQDPVDVVADAQTLQDLRYTLEQSGAFHVANADKENVDDALTEEQRLQKWTCAKRKIRADAAPFVPKAPLLGHKMASRARLRRTPQKRLGGRLERYGCDERRYASTAMRRPDPREPYVADLTQFIVMKRPKRKSQESEEAEKARAEEEVVEDL